MGNELNRATQRADVAFVAGLSELRSVIAGAPVRDTISTYAVEANEMHGDSSLKVLCLEWGTALDRRSVAYGGLCSFF